MNKKRLFASVIASVMVLLCIAVLPQTTFAEETQIIKDGIVYDKTYDMNEYWTEETKTAPAMDGYVFGGWYVLEDQEKFSALKQSAIEENGIPTENVYAKFVPANVLTVKAQVPNTVGEDTPNTHMRVITSIDSLEYGNVGFDIWFNNKAYQSVETTKAFGSLVYTENEKDIPLTPEELFGDPADYFVILKINGIGSVNYAKLINVRPYWTTLDGTKVEGMAKYVHVEDSYSEYISVPINLQSGKEVAAGIVTMTYDKDTLELIKTGNSVENGRVFKELDYNVDEKNGIIRFAANSDTKDAKDRAQGIFANVRFQVKTGKTEASSYDFQMEAAENTFANWDEEFIDVYAVDYRY